MVGIDGGDARALSTEIRRDIQLDDSECEIKKQGPRSSQSNVRAAAVPRTKRRSHARLTVSSSLDNTNSFPISVVTGF